MNLVRQVQKPISYVLDICYGMLLVQTGSSPQTVMHTIEMNEMCGF